MPHIIRIMKHRRVMPVLVLLAADALLFGLTNAQKAPSYLLIVGLILLALTIYTVVYAALAISKFYGISIRRQKSLAVYVTAVLGGLLALQSVGELNSKDVWVLLPLAALGYFYSAYAKAGRRNLSG